MLIHHERSLGPWVIHISIYIITILILCTCIITPAFSKNIRSTDTEVEEISHQSDTDMNEPYEQFKSIQAPLPMIYQRKRDYNYTDVLVIYNANSPLSIKIAKYFQNARNIPEINMVNLTNISAVETVSRTVFEDIRGQIESHLEDNNLTENISYFVTTKGVPLRVSGGTNYRACLDSELTMILGQYQGYIGNNLWFINPYFEKDEPFAKTKQDLYLVTRLTGFTWPEIKQLIDNATVSGNNRGTYVLDEDATKGYTGGYGIGNVWIRDANTILTAKGEQTYYDNTNTFVTGQTNVIGYASWGSNDAHDTTNIVANYGFESSTGNLPNNWYPIYDPGINDNIIINSTDAYSGTDSLQINRSSTSSNFTAIAQNISISPETRYYLRGRVNVTEISGPGGAHIQVQTLDSQDKLLKVQNTNLRTGITSSWVSFSQVIYETNANAAKVRLMAILNQSSGRVNFDQITFNDIQPHNKWVPGAIAETFVSTGGRSFNYGTIYGQSLIADLIRDGVTGVKGYVYEPYLSAIAHPDLLFDRYTDGYNLAESYYMASNFLGWMDVVVGDPKMAPYSDTLPDFNISIDGLQFSPATPNEDEEIIVNYTVFNIGNRTVDDLLVKTYLVAGEQETLIREQTIDTISGNGGFKSFEIDYTPTITGDAKIKVIIDPDNVFKEQDENNNLVQKQIYINNLPTASKLSILDERIYRTQQFELEGIGSDIETPTDQLTPLVELKLEPRGYWHAFQQDYITHQYNSITDAWDFIITSNTSMVIGKYSFRLSFTDSDLAVGNYYFLHNALEVLNNPPIIENITIQDTELNRTNKTVVICIATDIEDGPDELIVMIEYRSLPQDITSEKGWVYVDDVWSSIDYNFSTTIEDDYWWSEIEFDKEAKLGYYQVRTQVIDKDMNSSGWVMAEQWISVLNNKPMILNFTASDHSVLRTAEIDLVVTGFDAEDENKLATMTCEIKYTSHLMENDPVIDYYPPPEEEWHTEYLDDIDFDYSLNGWRTGFKPPKDAPLGYYLISARILDNDDEWSNSVHLSQLIKVLNNPPEARLDDFPSVADEDDEITFNTKKSSDLEDESSELIYNWELRFETTILKVDNSRSFTYTFPDKGEYQVILKVTDSDGAYDWENSSISIENVKPTANFDIKQRSPKVNQQVEFDAEESTDTTSDIVNLTYTWAFGDGATGTGKTVNHTYFEAKTYTVTLTVTDDDEESSTTSITLRILPATAKPEKPDTKESNNDLLYYSLIGVVIFIVVILVLVFLFIMVNRKKKASQEQETLKPETYPPGTSTPGISPSQDQLPQQPQMISPPQPPPQTQVSLDAPQLEPMLPLPGQYPQQPTTTMVDQPEIDTSMSQPELVTPESPSLIAQDSPTLDTSITQPKLPPASSAPEPPEQIETPEPKTESPEEESEEEQPELIETEPEPTAEDSNEPNQSISEPEDQEV